MRFYENSRNVFLKNQHPTLRNIPFSRILTYLFHFFPADRTRYFYKIFERIFSFKKKKKYQKNEFHLSGIFRNISLGRIIFFFLGQIFVTAATWRFREGRGEQHYLQRKMSFAGGLFGNFSRVKIISPILPPFHCFYFFRNTYISFKNGTGIIISIISSFILVYNTRKYKS